MSGFMTRDFCVKSPSFPSPLPTFGSRRLVMAGTSTVLAFIENKSAPTRSQQAGLMFVGDAHDPLHHLK